MVANFYIATEKKRVPTEQQILNRSELGLELMDTKLIFWLWKETEFRLEITLATCNEPRNCLHNWTVQTHRRQKKNTTAKMHELFEINKVQLINQMQINPLKIDKASNTTWWNLSSQISSQSAMMELLLTRFAKLPNGPKGSGWSVLWILELVGTCASSCSFERGCGIVVEQRFRTRMWNIGLRFKPEEGMNY